MQLPPIPPVNVERQDKAAARQQQLTKPPGALGHLETLSIRLAGMTGRLDWLPVRRAVIVCAGDHGVTAQGVSVYPQAVTAQMVRNFLRGGAAVNVLARQMTARVRVVDAGVAADLEPHPDLISVKVGWGTQDFTQGRAMTAQQAWQAIEAGIQIAQAEMRQGVDVIAVGEMGIGNTTAASAIVAAITASEPAQVTGRGTGVSDRQLAHKVEVIQRALALHHPANQQTLEKVGGFEIGVMAGVMIGAAAARIPVLIDGLISTAAGLIAAQYAPQVADYLIASHRGSEPGHHVALDWLGLEPLLALNLRLGEGTGAVLALPLVEAAMRTLQEMATFGEAGVSGPA